MQGRPTSTVHDFDAFGLQVRRQNLEVFNPMVELGKRLSLMRRMPVSFVSIVRHIETEQENPFRTPQVSKIDRLIAAVTALMDKLPA